MMENNYIERRTALINLIEQFKKKQFNNIYQKIQLEDSFSFLRNHLNALNRVAPAEDVGYFQKLGKEISEIYQKEIEELAKSTDLMTKNFNDKKINK